MKVTAFDPTYPYQRGTGSTLGSSAGGDLDGSLPSPTVVGIRGISITSNLPISVGQVLTASQISPPLAIWATPSNSVAAGSNSTHVRETSTAGVSTTLWAPFDHAHAGIGTITASSSNTLQRGTVNLRPGSGVAFGLTDTDGDGEFDTLTVSSTGGGGGGGGSGAQTKAVYDAAAAIVGTTPSSMTDVPDLATISMTTTATCTFIYTYSCQLVKGNDAHKCKFNPVRDSTTIPNPIHSQSVGEGAIQQMSHTWVEKSVASGTYTVKMQYNAAIGTSSTTFAAQHFVVTAVPE